MKETDGRDQTESNQAASPPCAPGTGHGEPFGGRGAIGPLLLDRGALGRPPLPLSLSRLVRALGDEDPFPTHSLAPGMAAGARRLLYPREIPGTRLSPPAFPVSPPRLGTVHPPRLLHPLPLDRSRSRRHIVSTPGRAECGRPSVMRRRRGSLSPDRNHPGHRSASAAPAFCRTSRICSITKTSLCRTSRARINSASERR